MATNGSSLIYGSGSVCSPLQNRGFPDGLRNRLSSCRPAKQSLEDLRSQARAWERVNAAKQMRARKKSQQTLNTLSPRYLFHRHFDNISVPRKLTNMNILINGSGANNRQAASFLPLRTTISQFPFYAKRKDRTHAVIPAQAVSGGAPGSKRPAPRGRSRVIDNPGAHLCAGRLNGK